MPLGPETLSGIVDIQIGRIRERVAATYGTTLSLSPAARDALISRARTSEMGARAIEVMIARDLLPVLSTFFLDAVAAGKKITGITIGYDGQRFGLDAEEAAPQEFGTPGESRLSDEVAPSRKRTRGAGRRKATTP
jgi:type VI secretion system protein VasG